MRRDGSASPDAVSAARTRSRASDTALSGKPDHVEGRQPGRDLHLDRDVARLDALERDGGDPLDHASPASQAGPENSGKLWAEQEHLQNEPNLLRCVET